MMGEYRAASLHRPKTTVTRPIKSALTEMFQNAGAVATTQDTQFSHCPSETLQRLRGLNESEIITLFTPVVPHPPSTTLARNMDPFEPLGRAMPRKVRHVPYRLEHGMTETHVSFLSASGAVVIVVCATTNVLSSNTQALDEQLKFARGIWQETHKDKSLAGVPVVLFNVARSSAEPSIANVIREFPAVVTLPDYTPTCLDNAARSVFQK